MRLAPSDPRIENLLLCGADIVGVAVAYLPPLGRQGAAAGIFGSVVAWASNMCLQARNPLSTRATHEVEVGSVAEVAKQEVSELLALEKAVPPPTDGKAVCHLADVGKLSCAAAALRLRAAAATLLRGDDGVLDRCVLVPPVGKRGGVPARRILID